MTREPNFHHDSIHDRRRTLVESLPAGTLGAAHDTHLAFTIFLDVDEFLLLLLAFLPLYYQIQKNSSYIILSHYNHQNSQGVRKLGPKETILKIKMMTTNYNLLPTEEGKLTKEHVDKWRQYPGERREILGQSHELSRCAMLVKTGGNALQAVDRRIVEQNDLVKVVVPDGVDPGQTLVVACPDGSGRMVRAQVPEGAIPGKVFFVRIPPVQPFVVIGVPVEQNGGDTIQNPLVDGHDISPSADAEHDLLLQEEEEVIFSPQEPTSRLSRSNTVSSGSSDDGFEIILSQQETDPSDSSDDDGFEMVPNNKENHIV